jgi:hypothetical protein
VASKKTVSISFPDLKAVKGLNPKVKIAIAFVAAVILLSFSYNAGNEAGYKDGETAGYANGVQVGDEAGYKRGLERAKEEYENGYWDGRVDGCKWLIDSLGNSYVIGLTNPFTTYYFLMGIGDTYAGKEACSIDGSGGYVPPTISASTPSN